MPKKEKFKTAAQIVKDNLLCFAEEIIFSFSRHNYMEFAEYKDMQRRALLKEKRELLRELKRRKWIETKTVGNRILARLTEQGWQQALRHKIRTETNKCSDGVCIVIFDIPESERFVRNVLRSCLKEWGFKKLQHSVWLTERDVLEPMMLLLQRRGLDKWIRVIKGTVLKSSTLDPLRARLTHKYKK